MRVLAKFLSAAAVAGSLAAMSVPAAAADVTTFANYSQATGGKFIRWTQSAADTGGSLFTSATSLGTTPGSENTFFTIWDTPLVNLNAKFTLLATVPDGNSATLSSGRLTQGNLSGEFSFIYSGADFSYGGVNFVHNVTNLLHGVFSGGSISGNRGATSGSTDDATTSLGTIAYTSDFYDFADGDRDFSIALTGITLGLNALPTAGAPIHSLRNFNASSGGQFSAVLAVPEPATWAMMLVGFGGIGALLRRRRQQTAFA